MREPETVIVDTYEEYPRASTDRAFAVWDGKSRKGYGAEPVLKWLPRALVTKGHDGFEMPLWLAEEKGLI